jgi:Asp-tRNA(Asn)/Glu-tRNA(Gln) amidotransferase A subunit family amidase
VSAVLAPVAPTDLTQPGALAALRRGFDQREGDVLAFVPEEGRWERLEAEVARLAGDRAAHRRDPLYGLPLGVKDIFHVDGFPTRAGSELPPEELAGPESTAVTRLRAAGALVVGKSVTTEFAYFSPGPTRNPTAPGRTPGGSSSGSAAAVAAGLVPVALGTQTIGSICRPAAYCGVVGFKPTYDRVPRDGVIPLSPSLDHVGWLAASVELADRVAAVLCDDWRSVAVSARPTLAIPVGSYLERCSPGGLATFRGVCARLAAEGFKILEVAAMPTRLEVTAMPDYAAIDARHRLLVAAEAWQVHADWFARYGERYHAETRALLERGRDADALAVGLAWVGRARLRVQLEALMDLHGIDLWITPPAPGPPPLGLESTGDPVMNLPWTHAGMPALALPVGRDADGLPHGIQLVARAGDDEVLLTSGASLAEELDQ